MSEYAFDHQWHKERERLAGIEAGMDPGTIRCLEAIGVADGWLCLEVGAGGGSIAQWLCKRVGPKGQVVATDLQTKFLQAIEEPNLEIRTHDIENDNLETDYFDLAHTRAVLEHLRNRDMVLKRIIAAVRPGGWVCIEAHDFFSNVPVSALGGELFAKATRGALQILRKGGFDPEYGRKLGTLLRAAGLEDVEVEGRVYEIGPNRPLTGVWAGVFQRLHQPLVESGHLLQSEVEEVVSIMYGSDFCAMSPTFVTAWGRKPMTT